MNERLHIADTDLTLYAMGTLPADEIAPIEAHLRVCARCAEELRQDTLALAAYAQTTPEVAPPEGARSRFLAKLSESPQAEAMASSRPAPIQARPAQAQERAPSWFSSMRWSPVLAGALAVLLVTVGVDDLRKRAEIGPLVRQARHGAIDSVQLSELMELLTSPQAKKVALHQTPVATPPPEGRVVYEARTGKLLLTASNLDSLPAGKIYELWILQPGGKKPLPAGTFEPDSTGSATMILASEPAGLAVQGFGVTIENAGGSDTPTLPIVLSGL
ncbi:MAG TPA: anti-sigma factor [Terracidiphilus sp.]|jgi:anti-sigma-K factor RskA